MPSFSRLLTGSPGRALVLVACLATSLHAQIVINEIHSDPADKTIPEEFLELYNAGLDPVDLTGWHLSDGIEFSFPAGTVIGPDEYLVVAEDPATIRSLHGDLPVVGPYEGRLANEGEEVSLWNADLERVDRVDYRVGFPWPIDSNGKGSSMELIHPSLDNDLGSSWRASGIIASGPPERVYLLPEQATGWSFRKGTSEASDPVDAWRQLDFVEDGTWLPAQTGIGYQDDDDNTVLDDMRGNYSSIFLRRKFTVASEEDIPPRLKLGIYTDDGCIVWINGQQVGRFHVDDGELAFDDFANNHEAIWEDSDLPNPANLLQVGENIIAIHAFNGTIRSSDFSIDASIFEPAAGEGQSVKPSPGIRNSVYSEVAPPNVRQVGHEPLMPRSGNPFTISAKVTDPQGVREVLLHYQVVAPGSYIPAHLSHPHSILIGRPNDPFRENPAFEDPANWTTVAMLDDGLGGDLVAGDDVYTARVPGQDHRTLFRYRVEAVDDGDSAVVAPFPDDPSLNFAAFIYDGVPPYQVSTTVQPGGGGHVYSAELMSSLPVYHLITLKSDWDHCIAYSGAFQIPKSNERARDRFNWEGAFVYDGVVYDHVRYRLRQANDRYGGSGKRSMRIRFKRGHYLEARDNYGDRYPEKWRTLNTGKMFDNKDVGNFGLTETLNANLWNLVGVPSPWMHTFHLRVIDNALEAPPGTSGQYSGDFHGMHLAMENYDAIFLDTHDLDDGNLYKLKDGIFRGADLLRNQGRDAVKPDPDFQNIRANLRPTQSVAWLDAHVNYDRWYPYHTICEAIRHYDFRPADSHSKNRAWYFEPDYSGTVYGRLWTLPHDSDASWGPNWNSGEDYSKAAIFNNGGKPVFKIRYRNFIREFRDLIWTREVIDTMIDDLAAFVFDFANADRDRFRTAPASEGRQDFGSLVRKVADMKNFAFVGWSGSTGPTVPGGGRARHLDNLANAEGTAGLIPAKPALTYEGPAGFPADGLTFRTSAFQDPQGDGTFGAREWMLAEITPVGMPFQPTEPRRYEYDRPWRTGEITENELTFTFPPRAAKSPRRYRARVRVKDTTDRWSHWSDPIEFTTTPPASLPPVVESLKITEVMYNPSGGSGFEFVELQNLGTGTIDLSQVRFTEGIEFDFAGGSIPELAPGQILLIVRDLFSFQLMYPTIPASLIAGEYSGSLSNSGEDLELTWGGNHDIIQFDYVDDWYKDEVDGGGHSLQVADPFAPAAAWNTAANWVPSTDVGGSPGREDFPSITAGLRLPGDANQDANLDLGDAVGVLLLVYRPELTTLPCEGEHAADGGNLLLLDFNGDSLVDGADAVGVLSYLFLQGPPHSLGTTCQRIEGCSSLPCF